jgi:hypothetical protein
MHLRLSLIAAALITCTTPIWAATASLPTYEVYSAATDSGTNLFSDPAFVPQTSVTNMAGATATITGSDYTSSAYTTLGSNHTYVQGSAFPTGVFSASGFSGWYDQVTITGGTGTGTVQISVQLNGTVTAGAYLGAAAFGLLASSVHPSQLTSDTLTFNVLNTMPWALDSNQVTEIALYDIVASPYNDPNQIAGLFTVPSTSPNGGIPAIPDLSSQLGGDSGMGFPEYVPNLILTPGANQAVNVALTGTLTFTYGEAFYLIGGLGTSVIGDGLESFCSFPTAIGDTCSSSPVKDGTGATTLDFTNSANLINIALPEGATASFASGASYNVTAVPEPAEWLMLLAGLGLVGWRARLRA